MDMGEACLVEYDGNGMEEGGYLSRSRARLNSCVLWRRRFANNCEMSVHLGLL